jgi:hypothetical protein
MPALLISSARLGRPRRRRFPGYSLGFVLIAVCLLQSGCGAGMSVGNKDLTGTSAGTYHIVVTGTSNGVMQSTTITMNVL